MMLVLFSSFSLVAAEITELINDGYIEINSDNEAEYESMLIEYIDHPLLWEETGQKAIEDLPVNYFLQSSLVLFHKNNKSIKSWREFQEKSGFSHLEMETIKLFFRLQKPETISFKLYNFNELRKDEQFVLHKNLLRFVARHPGNWQFRAVAERDRGEPHIYDHKNFALSSPPVFNNQLQIWLGSFRLNWGTGLFYNSNPMNLMLNTGTPSLYRASSQFRSYGGSDESNYLFGTAIKLATKSVNFFSFYAKNRLDCRFEGPSVSSVDMTGFHSTELQLENRDKLRKSSYALGINKIFDNLEFGVLFHRSDFNYPLLNFDNKQQLTGISGYHSWQSAAFSISGEIAVAGNRTIGLTQSLQYRTKEFRLGIGARYIEPGFHSFSGSILRNFGGQVENEKGYYAFIGLKPGKFTKIAFYSDYYSRIIPAAIGADLDRGSDSGFYLRQRTGGRGSMEFKISRKNDTQTIKTTYSLRVKTRVNRNISLNNRVILISATDGKESDQAYNSYLNMEFNRIDLNFGTTHYFADQYRIYLYEPGIPFRFNMVSLGGSGHHYFVAIQYHFNPSIECYFTARQYTKALSDKYSLQLQLLVAL
ncbi:MAG: hypothetical protein ACLFQM_00835 [Fidelibacterota bacterium]